VKPFILIPFVVGASAVTFATAQTPQQPTADIRALQATTAELTQAWTGARAAMIAAQDQVQQLSAENRLLKDKYAALEAKEAKALPAPQQAPYPQGTKELPVPPKPEQPPQ
jgi:selenocysteine-specific translation elongation factor